MHNMFLEISHLAVHYPGAPRPAVRNVSFGLHAGEIGVLIGPSGCGKTTLLRAVAGLEAVTEYRSGTYVYFDRSLSERGTCSYDDVAISVLSTVVSRPTGDRAMLDAGTKALTSDLLGLKGYGIVRSLGDAQVYNANEEHGFLDISAVSGKPAVGDLVRITPNHACPVSNLFDRVVFVDGDEVLGAVKVDARGTVQ